MSHRSKRKYTATSRLSSPTECKKNVEMLRTWMNAGYLMIMTCSVFCQRALWSVPSYWGELWHSRWLMCVLGLLTCCGPFEWETVAGNSNLPTRWNGSQNCKERKNMYEHCNYLQSIRIICSLKLLIFFMCQVKWSGSEMISFKTAPIAFVTN